MENNQVSNWSVELSLYNLNIKYINCRENILENCLPRLVDANLTECDYEPKAQDSGCVLFEDLSPIVNTEYSTAIISINVLESTMENTVRSKDINMLQGQDTYCKTHT